MTTALNGVLGVSLILSVIFCLQFIFVTRELRSLTGKAANINATRANMSGLINDCARYSEKNPALDPILESIGVKLPKTAAPKPAGK